jgi:uncharacterized membrane protein
MLKISPFDRWLYAFTGFIVLLIGCRMVYFNSMQYVFLVFNLALAWLPYFFSSLFQRAGTAWGRWLLLGLWLLFLPNAFYIVTDLVHLRRPTPVPVWLDALIVFGAAVAGTVMALASLYRAEKILAQQLRPWQLNAVLAGILLASGFGVYLGRFLRWYSWDVFTKPGALFVSVAERILFPHQHLRTWAVSVALALVFGLLYRMAKKLPRMETV